MSSANNHTSVTHSLERVEPSLNRASACDSCKIRKKRCPRLFDNEGRCNECRRLGLECVRGHPAWLDDADSLNSFRRAMLRTVKLARRNRYQNVTPPWENVSGQFVTPAQRHEKTPWSPAFPDINRYSYLGTTLVNPIHEGAGSITGQAGAARYSHYQSDKHVPFRFAPYRPISTPLLPTIPTTTRAAPADEAIPALSETPYHKSFPAYAARPSAIQFNATDAPNRSPYNVTSSFPQNPLDTQLGHFVNQLHSCYPQVRRIVIETDYDAQFNDLYAEAELVNSMSSSGDATVFVQGRRP